MRIRFIDAEKQDPRIQHRRRQQARRTRLYRQRQQARNAIDVHQPSPTSVGVDGHTETESAPIQIEGSTESGEHGSNDESVGCVEGDAAEYDCGPYVNDEPSLSGEEHDLRVETHIPQANAALPPTALAHFLTVLLKVPNVSEVILDVILNRPPEQHNDDSLSDHGGLSISEGLNYITAELGSEVPNILASGSIKEPEIKFSSEKLQYLYTGLTSEYGYSPRPRIEPSKGCAIEPPSSSEFDIDSLRAYSNSSLVQFHLRFGGIEHAQGC